jgi:hypothetical protein
MRISDIRGGSSIQRRFGKSDQSSAQSPSCYAQHCCITVPGTAASLMMVAVMLVMVMLMMMFAVMLFRMMALVMHRRILMRRGCLRCSRRRRPDRRHKSDGSGKHQRSRQYVYDHGFHAFHSDSSQSDVP